MSIKETIEQLKELKRVQAHKFIDAEVLGFKVKEYTHSSRGNKYKSLYAVKCERGKKTQIFLGTPESLAEIEAKIQEHLITHS